MTGPDRIWAWPTLTTALTSIHADDEDLDTYGLVEYIRRDPAVLAALPEVHAMIAGAYEAAAHNIEDYPRVAPDAAEAQHYDEQIEHAQAIIRALTPADAIAARDAMIAEAVAKEREACAQEVDDWFYDPASDELTDRRLSDAIRKRGEGQP